jgi:hypothetical protein
MAQKLNEVQESLGSSKTDAAGRPGLPGERRSRRDLSFWAYPEKAKTIPWSKTIKKEAKGVDGLYLGKVQAVEAHHVRTVKGLIRKETFLIPRELVQAFDGSKLWFGVEPGLEHQRLRMNPSTRDGLDRSSPVQSPNVRMHGRRASRGFFPVFWTSKEKFSIA